MNPPNVNLEVALRKRLEGRGLKNGELGALLRYDRGLTEPARPVGNNYRPLGAITAQVLDRIHTLQEPHAGGEASTFNNELHFENSHVKIDIDGGGIAITNKDANDPLTGNPAVLFIDPSLLTHDMGIRSIGYYDAGVPKTIDIIASASY